MKKTLLLSVAASAFIMAGGDIAPVEPAVAAPAVSGWDFSGTAKFMYQTASDAAGAVTGSDVALGVVPADTGLFDQGTSAANAGIQLRATNNDVFAGIGAGFELSGLATLDLEQDVVSAPMQMADNTDLTGAWISQAYLTYGFGNTSIKIGRQELPKALSPMAFSEDWNMFKNTYDAALLVNTDLPDTTAVLAYVRRANMNMMGVLQIVAGSSMNEFNSLNGNDGVWMLTLQNKSIENVVLTGSYYFAKDFTVTDDLTVLWGDAQIAAGDFTIGLQAAQFDTGATSNLFGAKVGTTVSDVNVALAYVMTDDGAYPHMIGGTTSAAYSSTVANQLLGGILEINADKWVLSAGAEALGGNISAAYAITDSDVTGDTDELDLVYSTNITDSISVMAAYVYLDNDLLNDSDVIRLGATYNF